MLEPDKQKKLTPQRITSIKLYQPTLIAITLFVLAIGGYDIFVLAFKDYGSTISYNLLLLAKQWPIIPFTIGVFMGHLFFPNRAAGTNNDIEK